MYYEDQVNSISCSISPVLQLLHYFGICLYVHKCNIVLDIRFKFVPLPCRQFCTFLYIRSIQ